MNSIEEAKQEIQKLLNKSKFEKMVGVTALLTSLLHIHQIKPIIVGGLAVELYTRGDYTTVDIDLVLSRRDLADQILTDLDFSKEGRHWYHDQLLVSLEIPGDMLEDADRDRVIEIKLANGRCVYVIGIEDIILDRLRACIHWKSTSDCEWAERLYLLHSERVNITYLENVAKKDGTIHFIKNWKPIK